MLKRVWFHRSLAALWLIFGVVSFIFGWQESVALVWLASVYANTASHWAGAEAADDHTLVDRLDCIERKIDSLRID